MGCTKGPQSRGHEGTRFPHPPTYPIDPIFTYLPLIIYLIAWLVWISLNLPIFIELKKFQNRHLPNLTVLPNGTPGTHLLRPEYLHEPCLHFLLTRGNSGKQHFLGKWRLATKAFPLSDKPRQNSSFAESTSGVG